MYEMRNVDGRRPGVSAPNAGVAVSYETLPHAAPAEHEKSSVPGAFGGLLFGVIAAPVLIIFGTLLCLTGLGAFLGVPMIIAAFLAPLAGPLFGIGRARGAVPLVQDAHDHGGRQPDAFLPGLREGIRAGRTPRGAGELTLLTPLRVWAYRIEPLTPDLRLGLSSDARFAGLVPG